MLLKFLEILIWFYKMQKVWKTNLFFESDVEQNNAILDELETFADAITNNTNPIVTLEQATEALKVAYQIIDCFKK
jgi:predicted dehydrogenase